MVVGAGMLPQLTVISINAVIVGNAAGSTVISRDVEDNALPQASVAVHVSVTVPPQAEGVVLKVEALDEPESWQPPLRPFEYAIVLAAGNAPHATVISAGALIVGKSAGFTVIILETALIVLPQRSLAVHVSVTVPPQAPGIGLKVLGLEVPLIKQSPLNPLLKFSVDAAGILPQATVIAAGGVIVGKAAGLTVISRETELIVRPQLSVAVQVSVTVPPHTLGVALKVDRLDVPEIRQPPLKPLL